VRGTLGFGGLYWRVILAGDQRDGRVDLDVLGAGGNEDLLEPALIDRLDLHRRLVGLDLGDDVAGLDLLALVDEPLRECPLLHGGRQRRHEHLCRHLARAPL
jgi:hypothetical protein